MGYTIFKDLKMNTPKKLYHGTCKAFVAYALQNEGRFGSYCDRVSFTPNLEHALMYAESWQTDRGQKRLGSMILFTGEMQRREFAEPVVLEFEAEKLGPLKYNNDCGADEYYVERGPVNLDLAKLVEKNNQR